uniref:Anaphase-promoting complex subunit 4 WD40 domain-containing protein n=3 Tax=Bionectria ochroleuca TaxID=29856 RepID=A0A8H7N1D2_BIOOC
MAADWSVSLNEQVQRSLNVDLVHTLSLGSVVCCVRFSHDGKYLATGCNKTSQIYDVATGKTVCEFHHGAANDDKDMYVRGVSFSPDGKYLATSSEDKLVRVWDVDSQTIKHTLSGHKSDIYSLDNARDGRTIASGGGDETVRLWDVETGAATQTFSAEAGVTSVAISPDSAYVAAGSLDDSIRIWSIEQGTLVDHLKGTEGHKDSVYSVAFTSDGKQLVSASLDKTAKLWELSSTRGTGADGPAREGRCLKTFKGHDDLVLSAALTRDNAWVISGSKDRSARFWDAGTGQAQVKVEGHDKTVISVATSPTGNFFATGSGDGRARIWSYEPAKQ